MPPSGSPSAPVVPTGADRASRRVVSRRPDGAEPPVPSIEDDPPPPAREQLPLPRRNRQGHLEPQLRVPGGAGDGTPFVAFLPPPFAPPTAPRTADRPDEEPPEGSARAAAIARAAAFRAATWRGRGVAPPEPPS